MSDNPVAADSRESVFDGVVVFPREVFSPVPNSVAVDLSDCSAESTAAIEQLRRQYVTQSTVAIHWWQKSWYKKA